MNKLIKDQWVAALRSGDYIQGRGELIIDDDELACTAHCCLGVLTTDRNNYLKKIKVRDIISLFQT